MKYLIFFLLISVNAVAQMPTHVKLSPVGYGADTLVISDPDTIDVVMLVCDTSDIVYEQIFMYGEIVDGKHVDYFKMDTTHTGEYDNSLWWMFGKEVQEINVSNLFVNETGELNWMYRHKEYLDSSGDKLRDGIVVWMAKQIK